MFTPLAPHVTLRVLLYFVLDMFCHDCVLYMNYEIGDPPKGDNVNTFLLYVDVHSIDDSLKLIKQHGGSVTKEKQGVPGMGFFAQAKDIEGGHIGLWQNVKSPHA